MDKYLSFKNFKVSYSTIFLFVFLSISFYYNYQQILFLRPVGIHLWRNSVCATYAQNYFYGADFLRPEISCYISDNYTSDVSVAEFPGYYYLIGLIYKFFGLEEFLFRLVNVIMGYIGLLALFKLSRLIIKDVFYSFVAPVIIFSATVFAFYLNNFLIDPVALSISFIGLYLFYKYVNSKKLKHFVLSMIFFALAGLMKPHALISYFIIGFLFVLDFIFGVKLYNGKRLFNKPWRFILPLIIVLGVVFSWYLYSKIYSQLHGGVISPVGTRSIFIVSPERRIEIWQQIISRFNSYYYHSPVFLYLSGGLFIVNLVFIKRFDKLLNFFVVLSFIQVFIFNILFYFSIGRCDYYQICNLVFLVFLFLNFMYYLRTNHFGIFKSYYFKGLVIVLLLMLIHEGKKGMNNRFDDWSYHNTSKNFVYKFGALEPYLRQLGIERNDRVYVTPDPSIDISLYLMNQKGNTDFGISGTTNEKIEKLIPKGLQYIIIASDKIYEECDLSPYTNNKIGEFRGVDIYKVAE